MDADAKREAPSAFARSVGAGAACAVIGVLVCAFTYVARMFDFAPLKAVIVAEDRLYDRLHMPVIHFHDNAKPVVFIDIDDDALAAWPGYQATMTNTPRDLIASLTGEARSGGAAVIYLDFDFRNSLKEDQALAKELENSRTTPVLLPTFFSTSRWQPCETQSDDAAPIELQLAPAFDSLINQKGSPAIDRSRPSDPQPRRVRARRGRVFALPREVRVPWGTRLPTGGDAAGGRDCGREQRRERPC
jgi:hypothetical protein